MRTQNEQPIPGTLQENPYPLIDQPQAGNKNKTLWLAVFIGAFMYAFFIRIFFEMMLTTFIGPSTASMVSLVLVFCSYVLMLVAIIQLVTRRRLGIRKAALRVAFSMAILGWLAVIAVIALTILVCQGQAAGCADIILLVIFPGPVAIIATILTVILWVAGFFSRPVRTS